jgi:hypothetical protein
MRLHVIPGTPEDGKDSTGEEDSAGEDNFTGDIEVTGDFLVKPSPLSLGNCSSLECSNWALRWQKF